MVLKFLVISITLFMTSLAYSSQYNCVGTLSNPFVTKSFTYDTGVTFRPVKFSYVNPLQAVFTVNLRKVDLGGLGNPEDQMIAGNIEADMWQALLTSSTGTSYQPLGTRRFSFENEIVHANNPSVGGAYRATCRVTCHLLGE